MPMVTRNHVMSPNSISKLSIKQRRAIELLLVGKNCTEVASELGVARETVTRWKSNPIFIAEINRQQEDITLAARNRLQQMATKAIDVLENKLNDGNLKAATEVLKTINIYAETPETNPEMIICKQAESIAIAELNNQPFTKIGPGNEFLRELAGDIANMIKKKYGVENVGLIGGLVK